MNVRYSISDQVILKTTEVLDDKEEDDSDDDDGREATLFVDEKERGRSSGKLMMKRRW